MDKRQFIKQWMKTFEPDTFKTGQNGRYFYRSEDLSSGIDLEIFFEELLEDYESALAENNPTSQEQLAAPAVSKCEGIEHEGTVCRCCGKKLINPKAIFGFCDSECMETFRQTDC